jgi:hypothetical protein
MKLATSMPARLRIEAMMLVKVCLYYATVGSLVETEKGLSLVRLRAELQPL